MLYNFFWKYFSKFPLFTKINGRNHYFMVFHDFRHLIQICANFHYDIRNQRIKIRKYT